MEALPMAPAALAEMIALIEKGTISGKIGKDLLPSLLKGEGTCLRCTLPALCCLLRPACRLAGPFGCLCSRPCLATYMSLDSACRCWRRLGAGSGPGGVAALVEAKGLVQISDPAALAAMVDAVLAANPQQLEQYRAGKTKLQGFFVGQLMKESKGRANPTELNRILMEKLKGDA